MSRLHRLLKISLTLAAAASLGACGGGGEDASTAPRATALGVNAAASPLPVAFPKPTQPFAEPDADPFYAQPGAEELNAYPAGAVIRYRPVDARVFYGLTTTAQAWQLLYRTNDSHGAPVATGAAVIVPPNAPATGRKLLSYQPASDALTRRCAPSYGVLSGNAIEAVVVTPALAATGWVAVVSDYEGPHSQWLAGRMSGQGVLDGIRAAENFAPAGLDGAATPTMLWGYSGGGFATAWAAELQGTYAPELNIKGSAAGGPPASVEATAQKLDGTLLAGIIFAAAVGLDRAFPEMNIDAQFNAAGKAMKARVGEMCLGQELTLTADPAIAGYFFHRLDQYTVVPGVLAQPQVKAVLDQQRLGGNKPVAPMYYYEGISDEFTPVAVADRVVQQYCALGATVRYDRIAGEHGTAFLAKSPTALQFLIDRSKGLPAPNSCK